MLLITFMQNEFINTTVLPDKKKGRYKLNHSIEGLTEDINIDGIDNMKDMNDAINSYNARTDKGFINYEAQALLADKLADLSEKADGKEPKRVLFEYKKIFKK